MARYKLDKIYEYGDRGEMKDRLNKIRETIKEGEEVDKNNSIGLIANCYYLCNGLGEIMEREGIDSSIKIKIEGKNKRLIKLNETDIMFFEPIEEESKKFAQADKNSEMIIKLSKPKDDLYIDFGRSIVMKRKQKYHALETGEKYFKLEGRKEKNKEKYTCECGSVISRSSKVRHEKSRKHQFNEIH